MSELHDLTALEQGAAIRAGEVSSIELVEHYLARIEALNDEMGAFVTVTPEVARRAAAIPTPQTGPLAGVPTAIKDLQPTAGVPTMFGSAVMAGYIPDESDEVVHRIEAAAMPSLGKTATPEFGSPCYTEPEGYPPAVTPWDTTRMAGGSSGGAASAVAAGLAPIAQGSDGGGSIRIPASCCGLVGLKPSRGRVSGAPMFGDVTGLAVVGPVARTVRDAAAFLDVLAGPVLGEPSWAPPPTQTFLSMCDRDPGQLRIARLDAPVIAETEVHPECRQALDDTTRLLESLGHEVVPIDSPMPPEAVAVFETNWAVLTALSTDLLPPEMLEMIRPYTRWLGARGSQVSGPAFGLALGEMRRIAARTVQAIGEYDLVVTPTLAQPPLPVGALRDDDDPQADFEAQKRFTPWTSMWNVTGSPAISLPLHHTPAGLPVGSMLAAKPTDEATLLAVAAQIEAVEPWRDRHPACW